MSKSSTGWTITYATCSIPWASKMQAQTALSTIEAKCIALSTALREQIIILELLKVVVKKGIDM